MTPTDDLYTQTLPNGFSFRMREVEGGSFMMGSETGLDWEKPAHPVTVSSFYIAEFPVTQALWKAVMGAENNPSFFKGDNRPVENVSWNEVQMFLKKLNEKTGKQYRLPTEAEWEYAARGGKKSKGCQYSGSDLLTQVGWYDENSHQETKPVGLKDPNELGLYDLTGNVWEWCEDTWHSNYNDAPGNGSAWIDNTGSNRVYRGGSWYSGARYCRTSGRSRNSPSYRNSILGFRLSRTK